MQSHTDIQSASGGDWGGPRAKGGGRRLGVAVRLLELTSGPFGQRNGVVHACRQGIHARDANTVTLILANRRRRGSAVQVVRQRKNKANGTPRGKVGRWLHARSHIQRQARDKDNQWPVVRAASFSTAACVMAGIYLCRAVLIVTAIGCPNRPTCAALHPACATRWCILCVAHGRQCTSVHVNAKRLW